MNENSTHPAPPGAASPSALQTAEAYVKEGLLPVPIPRGEKAPKIPDWQHLRITEGNIGAYFGDEPANLGVLLGDSGLVDIDLDAPEAASIAPAILPPTRTFGRTSKPGSHYIYRTEERRPTKRFQITTTDGTETLVEFRDSSANGSSAQTVFPGSVHPSGEPIAWTAGTSCDYATVDADELMDAVKTLACMVVVLRLWPQDRGGRHDLAGALGSILGRASLKTPLGIEAIGRIVYAIAKAANDEEPGDRANFAKESAEKARDHCAVTGIPTLTSLLCSNEAETRMLGKALSWIGYREGAPILPRGAGNHEGSGRESVAAQIVRLATEHETEFWCAPDGTPHVTFKAPVADEHLESHPLHSKETEMYLRRLLYVEAHRSAKSNDVSEAQGDMESLCRFAGGIHETAVRVATAEVDGERRLYLDLGDPSYQVVEVRPDVWTVIPHEACPVRMVRHPGMLELPSPARNVPTGAGLEAVSKILNVGARDLPLVMAWLAGALYPVGEMPLLAFSGEQGTGKSSAARVIRSFLDPNAVPLRGISRTEHEAFIAATNAYILCYDNVSAISDSASDIMCRLSSGGGYAVRALYSNGDESLFQVKRPQMLTGITDVVTRGDLAERTLMVTLDRISPEARQTVRKLEAMQEAARPVVLGSLLDAAAAGLARLPSVDLAERPRLGDFAEWATACEPGLGLEEGSFLEAYVDNRRAMTESAVEDDPLAEAVRSYLSHSGQGAFVGTAASLLETLDIYEGYGGPQSAKPRPQGWPRTPRALSGQLRRAAPALRELGMNVGLGHRSNDKERRRMIELKWNSGSTGSESDHRPDRPTGQTEADGKP